jgi:hypothetical protein
MNQKLTYEQTITGKLELLLLPDMEAAIWKRIEFQLDIDMPADGGVELTPSPRFPKPGPLMLGAISIIFITALLLYSIFRTNDHSSKHDYPNPTKAPVTIPLQEVQDPPPIESKTSRPVLKNSPGATMPGKPLDNNTYRQQPVLSPDSNVFSKDRGDVIIVPSQTVRKDTVQTIKKKRGAQGITDDDYRVEPKTKDSLPGIGH